MHIAGFGVRCYNIPTGSLLCIVGVDGYTEQSTGIFSSGFLSTIATPTARLTTTTRDESSAPGDHGVIIILRSHIILELSCRDTGVCINIGNVNIEAGDYVSVRSSRLVYYMY